MRTVICNAAAALLVALAPGFAGAAPPCAGSVPGAPPTTYDHASCAAQSGQRAQAVLLLQRVLAEEPQHRAARELLLQLLSESGADGAAYEIPAAAALRSGREWWRLPAGTTSGGWLAFEAGHDSNINAGTDQASINIPLLGNRSVVLDRGLVAISSPFAGVNGGIALRHALTPDFQVYARGLGALRYNAEEESYLPHSYQGAAGAALRTTWAAFLLEATATERRLGRHRLHHRDALVAQAGAFVRDGLRVAVTLESARNRYPLFAGLRTRDQAAGVTLRYLPAGGRVRLFRGSERAEGAVKDLDRDFTGFSAGWETRLGASGKLIATLGHTRHRYLEPSLLFQSRRLDRTTEAGLEYEHSLGGNWYLSPRLVQERNASSLALTRFERLQLMVETRKEF